MITYVDTSTFVKLLIVEKGTSIAETIWNSAAIAVGADALTSADRRLCIAARTVGLHVINPLDE